MSVWRRLAFTAAMGVSACAGDDAAQPAPLDTRNGACAQCRMAVSTPIFAAQVAVPGEEPRFFDDIGCLADWIRAGHAIPPGGRAFVADHRTRAWVAADAAIFTRARGLDTPMGSGLVAHESAASRDQDAAARGGEPVPAADVLAGRAGTGR